VPSTADHRDEQDAEQPPHTAIVGDGRQRIDYAVGGYSSSCRSIGELRLGEEGGEAGGEGAFRRNRDAVTRGLRR
jgi:hypothetical protein